MSLPRRPLALVVGAGLLVVATPVAAGAVGGERVLTLRDPEITESSGLVDAGRTMVTTNDSGNAARVYVVGADGRTVGTTDFAEDAVDVEALAPAGPGEVWVGDIGDNDHDRRSVRVYRVPVGSGARQVRAASYELVYPRGRPDAESLFVDPRGRLNVVTKSFSGGTVYRAPARLSSAGPNRLAAVGQVAELATDAAFLRDGRHLLVRGYGQASVYRWPSLRRVGSLDLPAQPQGEGVSVGPGGRVRLSSEGVGTPILQVTLPTSLRAAMRGAATPSAAAAPATAERQGSESSDRSWTAWALPVVAVAVVVGGLLGALRLVLRRRPGRRPR